MREGSARARLIRIDVAKDGERMLIATSPDLPQFMVISLSHEELEQQIPETIKALYKQRFDQDVETIALETEGAEYPVAYAARPAERIAA
jgi:Tfp pilus assembly PilM family ATPase